MAIPWGHGPLRKGTFNRPFSPYLFEVIEIDPPVEGREETSLLQLQDAAEQHELAGFIFEPQIQGVGGMRTHTLNGLDSLLEFCHKRSILTIADEVMTGFGRTGSHFVCGQLQHPPAIICLAKGLSGGMLRWLEQSANSLFSMLFYQMKNKKPFCTDILFVGIPLAVQLLLQA